MSSATQAELTVPTSVVFHAASGPGPAAVAQVQADVRRRLLRAFVARGHIEPWDAKEMLAYKHSGFYRIAALVPPPRTHWHRYYGVLAPNSPLRGAVTAMAQVLPAPLQAQAHDLWAVLIDRIYQVFPLICPICAGQMRIIAFTTDGAEVRKILEHIGADPQAPRITPARGPPLWDECDAPMGEGVEALPDCDLAAQPAPDYQVDQRISW